MNLYTSESQSLAKRMGLAFLSFSLCRVVFYLFNSSKFQEAGLYEFFVGLRFDGVSIAWVLVPFIMLSALPIPFRESRGYQVLLKTFFHLGNGVCVIFNLIDVEFFKVINNRSTASLFDQVSQEQNFGKMAFDYSLDFWYLWIIAGLIIYLTRTVV